MEGILFYDTYLEYYLTIDPSRLPDEVWAMKIAYLNDLRQHEAGKPL